MATERDLDRRLADALRDALERELGPDPEWTESPAARRIAELGRRPRFRRRPIRLLAVAAILAVGGAAAILAGGLVRRPVQLGANGWIAYTVTTLDPSGNEQDDDIYLVGLDQRPRRIIGTDYDGLDQFCPAFSRDGARLAYGEAEIGGQPVSFGGSPYRNAALVIGDLDGSGHVAPSQRIEVGGAFPPPCAVWSPDGERVAFAVPLGFSVDEVRIVRLADRQVTVVSDLLATDLEWSPEGSQLAIASSKDPTNVARTSQDGLIYLYSIRTADLRSLPSTRGVKTLTWSPDGRRIAYEVRDNSPYSASAELRVVDVTTGRDQSLATGYYAIHGIGPVWSPAGDRIVYQRGTDGEGHDVALVTPGDAPNGGAPVNEIFRPGSINPYRVTWSPDARYLLELGWTAETDPGLFAVPVDPRSPAVALAANPVTAGNPTAGDRISAYEGYPEMALPIQAWGRRPSR